MNFCSQFCTKSSGRMTTLTIFQALNVFIISFVWLVYLLKLISSVDYINEILKQNCMLPLLQNWCVEMFTCNLIPNITLVVFSIFRWLCISLQFFVNDQLDALFLSLFITPLYMFQASQCSSSGDQIVLTHHLVWLVCVSDCFVCRSLLTGIPSSHLHRLIIPDDVLIQFSLLMISTVMLETCR